MRHRVGRGAIAVAVCLLVAAGCSESSDSSGTFVGDASASEDVPTSPEGPRSGSPSEAPGDAPEEPGTPSEAPGTPSEAPGSPSEEPGSPSEVPSDAPDEPGHDAAGGLTVNVGAQSWPYDKVGLPKTTTQWIRDFGIDGMIYPAGDQVQLLEVIVFTLADSQDRSASLYYDLFSDQSADEIAATFEHAIDGLGGYQVSTSPKGKSLVVTGSGSGLSDRYEVTVRAESDQDRYTVNVVRNWSASDNALPALIADPLQPAIDVSNSVGFEPAGWRYYEHLDYETYNESGRVVFPKQIDYHFAAPTNNAAGNADRLINAAGGATGRKTQANGVVFTAKGADWITHNAGGGNIQFTSP